jgi:hypothetical protein
MLIDNNQATIELSDHEVSVFLGKTTATEAMLESEDLPKPHTTFLNKVEYSAEKVYFVTERPVMIRTVSGTMIATYNECGLVIKRSASQIPARTRQQTTYR